jgi:RNase P/RNase MRP subunit POP5
MAKTKTKRLKLKPSARDKRRYLLVSGASRLEIESSILEYIGVLGFARAAYMYVKKHKSKIVTSCLADSLDDVRAALAMAEIKIDKVSGTLKGLGVQG